MKQVLCRVWSSRKSTRALLTQRKLHEIHTIGRNLGANVTYVLSETLMFLFDLPPLYSGAHNIF